jgi:hypothetical protein
MSLLLQTFRDAMREGLPWRIGSEPIISMFRDGHMHLANARDFFRSSGLERDAQEMVGLLAILEVVTNLMSPPQALEKLRSHDLHITDRRAGLHCLVQLQKLQLIKGEVDSSVAPSRLAQFFRQQAIVVVELECSYYWHCETLALSCVYSRIAGEPSSRTLTALRAGYENLGRIDRWTALLDAIDELPHNYPAFAAKYCAMLAW